jgi:uncharacterized repeat protein (TIGR01451 family)
MNNNVHNVATAHGTPPSGPNVTDTDPHDVEIPDIIENPEPEIELIKDGPATSAVGETITYTFEVTNTGETTLTNVHITDPLIGGGEIAVTPSTLAVGASGTATAQYTVDAADVVDNNVHNLATVEGTPPSGPPVTDTDPHDVEIPDIIENPEPEIELIKDGPATSAVGDTITYTFDVTNTGETTLTNVHITDPLLGSGQIAVTPSTLAVGATGTATAQYTVQQIHVINNNVHNVATVHGTPPSGPPVTDDDPHDVTIVPLGEIDPSINLEKDGPLTARQGDQITYTFKVTNTGNTTLTNVRIFDPMLSSSTIPVSPSTLEPNAVGTAQATYTVTVVDAEAGVILNTAIVRGQPPTGGEVEDDDDHTVEVPDVVEEPEPGIELDKSGPATANVGDTITYRFRATNTGRTTLTNVTITDPMLGGKLTVTPSTLAPGESGTASATYTVKPADGRRGRIYNTAIVTGRPPSGPPVRDDDDHETDVPGVPPRVPPRTPPELPATGADVPTRLLISALALLLGFALLRLTKPAMASGPDTWSIPAQRLTGAQSAPPVHRRNSGGWSTPRIG